MLSAETPAALDAGRTAVDREGEGVTPHAPVLRTLEGANTNPCPSFRCCEGREVF